MKNTIVAVFLVLLLCFAVGCQDKAEKAELEAFKARARTEERNMALYRKLMDELNKGNVEYYREAVAPDYAYYFPSASPKAMGVDETISMIKANLAGFPDGRWTIEGQVASGDVVVSRLITRGTHTAEYQGMPPTGKTFEMGLLNWSRFKDGKIVEEREEGDMLGFMQQVGLGLVPPEAPKE